MIVDLLNTRCCINIHTNFGLLRCFVYSLVCLRQQMVRSQYTKVSKGLRDKSAMTLALIYRVLCILSQRIEMFQQMRHYQFFVYTLTFLLSVKINFSATDLIILLSVKINFSVTDLVILQLFTILYLSIQRNTNHNHEWCIWATERLRLFIRH